MPNTTLEFIDISKSLNIKYKVFDTPGVPVFDSVTAHIEDY